MDDGAAQLPDLPETDPLAADAAASPDLAASADLGPVHDLTVTATVEVGRRQMKVIDALAITNGTVILLGRPADEPVDLLIQGRRVARGEVVVQDNEFGIRITEILPADHTDE